MSRKKSKFAYDQDDGDQGYDEGYGRLKRRPENPMPMQPIGLDPSGVARFRRNRIVRYLLDAGPFNMNDVAMLPGITNAERMQFAQLIGYSVSGAGDLSYFDNETIEEMDSRVELLKKEKNKSNE